jgi:phospholipase C
MARGAAVRAIAGVAGTLAVAACSGQTAGIHAVPAGSPPPIGTTPLGAGGIAHVVIVVQENRSFDNLFMGYPDAATATSGRTHGGKIVRLEPVSLASPYDVNHGLIDFVRAHNGGRMDGFDLEGSVGESHNPYLEYSYVPRSETLPYWTMAGQYALGDRVFTSQIDESFTAHQFLIAGQAGGTGDMPSALPWGCDAPAGTTIQLLQPDRSLSGGVFPCFDYPTLASELDAHSLSWRYYAPVVGGGDFGGLVWSAFDAIHQVRYGADWNDVVSPETRVLSDVQHGQLASVTWIVPDLANSDHASSDSSTGPDWVASIVNAIGESPFWKSTAIFVVWDDWGGWYDHIPPPQLDAAGLGIRVPLLVVSPYAKRNYVSHEQLETASILKFAEYTFGLKALSAADGRASLPDDFFDFTRPPRTFVPLSTRRRPPCFSRELPSLRPPDD